MSKFRKYGLSIYFIVIVTSVSAQNWIGMRTDSIVYTMRDIEPQYVLDRGAVNKQYKYLKYVDDINECTKLYFISDKNRCTLVRLMCSYSNLIEITDELNRKYETESENKWTYINKGIKYDIILEQGDWFFTVTTKKSE